MRPVNLIPREERRGGRAPARAGAFSYVVVGGLAAILIAVALLVTSGNTVKEKEAELADLQTRELETAARAESLSSFASFAQIKLAREQTVTELAQSRFDWARVMRELSLVLPSGVWLVNLTGTVAPDVQVDGGAGNPLRSEVPGPALELEGCARSQREVARLIAAVGDIDGVTRVTTARSERPGSAASPTADTSGANTNEDCRTRGSVTRFELVAAFDSVTAAPGATPPPAEEEGEAAGDGTEVAADGTAATPEQTEQQSSVEQQTDRADRAAGLIDAGNEGEK